MFRKGLVLVGLSFVAAFGLSGCGGSSSSSSGSGPLSVAVSASASNVDGTDSVTLTAVVSNDDNSEGVTWSLNGAGTLSNQTTTSATYTAPAATNSAQPVTVTATSVREETRIASTTITVAATPAITTTSSNLAGKVGTTYSVQLAGSGGVSPYTWTVVSGYTLPAGLSLSAAGVISGTPLAAGAGTTNVAFQMKDAGTPTAMSVTHTLGIALTAAPPITFTGTMPPTGSTNLAYAGSAAASGGAGALTYTVNSGALPTGLNLNAASGAVTGTITVAGTYNFTIKAVDAFGDSAAQGYQIVAGAGPVTITPGAGSLALAVTGQAYSQTLTASGGSGAGYVWIVSGLSNGLTSSANGATLTINGPATTAGTVNFTAKVTDGVGNSSGILPYSIQVYNPVTLPIPNPGTLPLSATVNTAYSGTITASGGSGSGYTYTVTGLPANGLNYSSSGGVLTISGTPATATAVSFGVSVKDSVGLTAGPVTYTITSYNTLTLPTSNPATLGAGVVSTPYTGTIAAAGGSGNYTWTVTGLPSDSLNYATSGGTLTISGTPGTITTVTFTAKVTDTTTNISAGPYTYTVAVYNPLTLPAPNPTSLGPADATSSYSGTIAVTGGSGNYSWTVTGLSDNLNYSTSGTTLTINGTPASASTVSFNVTVKDTTTNTSVGPYTYTVAVYNALALPPPNPTSLPAGFTSLPYTGSISASGGSGNYSWQVTGLSDNLSSSPSGVTLNIGGTPASTHATVTFNVTLKDTTTGVSVTQNGYSISISVPVTLPAPNPASLPTAIVNQPYTGSIIATGGATPYTWSVNGTPIPNTGTAVIIANGISVSTDGGNILTVSGTPTALQTVNLTNVKVTDSVGSSQTNSYTIVVNASSQVSGLISLNANCGGTLSVPPITVNLLTSPGGTVFQTVTTDSSGNYAFTNIPNGNFTISPAITGPSSVFYPATQSVTVNSGNMSGENFNVALGYTVSGTVSYGGANTGQIYLSLNPLNNCGVSGTGTSITAPGAFTIRGVAPGAYTLQAWMDLTALADGAQNTSDPAGSTSGVTVSAANVTGADVTVTDNTPTSVPSSNPAINAIAPTDQGVAISFKPITSNGVEAATSYDVEWSTSSTFSTAPVTYNFKAIGTGSNVWILNNGTSGISGSPFTDGQTYYFEARARNAAGPASGWTVYGGGTPAGVTIGASTSGNEVQGTVTIPAAITPTGPLYVGYYNQSTNTVYGTRIASPGSSNAFTVYVPTDTNNDYIFFEILDQNNDGLIDAGDVTNTNNNSSGVSISGPLTGQNLTLSTTNSTAAVTTQYYENTINSNGTALTLSGYNLNFDIREGNKLPVAVTLISGPNVINPVDIGNYCQGCGSVQFQYLTSINSDTPTIGDTYSFQVTYSDASTETITGSVTGWDATGSIVGPNNIPTNLDPGFTGPLAPVFSWVDPSVDSSDIFLFYIFDNNANTVWQVPASNSNSIGFPSSITSITYGTDPINPSNDLAPGAILNDQIQYTWLIQAQDSNGNQAQASVYLMPSGVL